MAAVLKFQGAPVAVIGAGVVGAAVARLLARAGAETWILEAGPRPAEGVTSRSSGVVHGGLYYEPGSLKARLCLRGRQLLYEWCVVRHVPHRKTGKLVVATCAEELGEISRILKNAHESGATEVRRLSAREVAALEPDVAAGEALFSPETGIVDPAEFTFSLLRDAEAHGAHVVCDSEVTEAVRRGDCYLLQTKRGPLDVRFVFNCAGLHADGVAGFVGVTKYKIHPWRGDYFTFRSGRALGHLVYPAKRRSDPGLGVHLTIDLGGRYRLGPDAEAVLSKEDFSPRPEKAGAFLAAARKLFPWAGPEMISYDTCGIRPKLRSFSDPEEKDFVISQDLPGWVNLVGIDSPGLTASMAIAEEALRVLG